MNMGMKSLVSIMKAVAIAYGVVFLLLLGGGLAYTAGIVFYKMTKVRYMHSVWHLFVTLGSLLHFLCVVMYVLPMTY